jgi:hypothetical protein
MAVGELGAASMMGKMDVVWCQCWDRLHGFIDAVDGAEEAGKVVDMLEYEMHGIRLQGSQGSHKDKNIPVVLGLATPT